MPPKKPGRKRRSGSDAAEATGEPDKKQARLTKACGLEIKAVSLPTTAMPDHLVETFTNWLLAPPEKMQKEDQAKYYTMNCQQPFDKRYPNMRNMCWKHFYMPPPVPIRTAKVDEQRKRGACKYCFTRIVLLSDIGHSLVSPSNPQRHLGSCQRFNDCMAAASALDVARSVGKDPWTAAELPQLRAVAIAGRLELSRDQAELVKNPMSRTRIRTCIQHAKAKRATSTRADLERCETAHLLCDHWDWQGHHIFAMIAVLSLPGGTTTKRILCFFFAPSGDSTENITDALKCGLDLYRDLLEVKATTCTHDLAAAFVPAIRNVLPGVQSVLCALHVLNRVMGDIRDRVTQLNVLSDWLAVVRRSGVARAHLAKEIPNRTHELSRPPSWGRTRPLSQLPQILWALSPGVSEAMVANLAKGGPPTTKWRLKGALPETPFSYETVSNLKCILPLIAFLDSRVRAEERESANMVRYGFLVTVQCRRLSDFAFAVDKYFHGALGYARDFCVWGGPGKSILELINM
eukprot:TRINITY_DN163_c0_g2_i1.p1 TRINITY_DN163_c0_g2~~TRINITY_DN163_c0_g2_i1.p1  ORF type:complete len:518 (+),score=54.91 TRINITY_DN163_c0_g2_i1:527-2080(+)